ncbi:16S rRNA (guanine(966)-N(2))-methyltransferase RsmD [Nocardioides sp. LHG3406-4]|uniref:16S rRNA (guanine(966)-N(2))-methyltransferase RsmD n=1 Tax=Nocardioides sp. LHG3406-4 TaxID=2804575 RepID=UPI003CF95132
MTRIIGGTAGGRRLHTPRGSATRPTSDRVREALFSAIESWCGSLSGLRFLDLYAGSGAVGLEAWSRGAGVVTLVEQDRRTAALIAENARELDFARAHVVTASVATALTKMPAAPYDVAFIDPPYPLETRRVNDDLAALVAHQWLVPGAMVVVERSSRGEPIAWPSGLVGERERRYGETMLWYGRAAPNPEE